MLCAVPSVGSNREARVASTPSTLQFCVPKKKKNNGCAMTLPSSVAYFLSKKTSACRQLAFSQSGSAWSCPRNAESFGSRVSENRGYDSVTLPL
ncbi:hypothetical protein EYF80_043934 [Liparis tanakae]|uniref:Uncharacterized protein n=1 Tax=Liparis tanakae TaxID=230148 RepID=A0A4Z2FZ87_9TELE|nr:hypothetical protein EYF80_043934 [Liparis tanakae]